MWRGQVRGFGWKLVRRQESGEADAVFVAGVGSVWLGGEVRNGGALKWPWQGCSTKKLVFREYAESAEGFASFARSDRGITGFHVFTLPGAIRSPSMLIEFGLLGLL